MKIFPGEEGAIIGVVGFDGADALDGLEFLAGGIEPGATDVGECRDPHGGPPVLPDRRERFDVAGTHPARSDHADEKGLVRQQARPGGRPGHRRRQRRGDRFVGSGQRQHPGANGNPGGSREKIPARCVSHEAISIWSR